MKYQILGKSGLKVSNLCFGSLTIGPLQKDLPLHEGVQVLEQAIEAGINFIDTADIYGTYPYIHEILKRHKDLIIATKSYAYDLTTAQETFERAIKGIGRDYVDIFLLHEQESHHTLRGHEEALYYLLKKKKEGLIRAVGLSTHYIGAVLAAADRTEIDIIHPILNYKGLGIVDGCRTDMEYAIRTAYLNGKGIYTMKPLGGGHLMKQMEQSFRYVLDFPYLHSIAIGMQRKQEVSINTAFFANGSISTHDSTYLNKLKRKLHIQDWCQCCGDCIKKCPQAALEINALGKLSVNNEKCIFCGYCGSVCKELAIKVI